MKYYWCVNCGYHGVFDFYRQRNIKCESCNYEDLTEFTESEWKESGHDKRHELDKSNAYYDGHLKIGPSRHAIKPGDKKDG